LVESGRRCHEIPSVLSRDDATESWRVKEGKKYLLSKCKKKEHILLLMQILTITKCTVLFYDVQKLNEKGKKMLNPFGSPSGPQLSHAYLHPLLALLMLCNNLLNLIHSRCLFDRACKQPSGEEGT
jgi:hypothetical protein